MVLLCAISILGAAAIIRQLPSDFLQNPQIARRIMADKVTPIDQIMYKCCIPAALVATQTACLRFQGRIRTFVISLIIAVAATILSLYGGRLLTLTMVLGVAIIWVHFVHKVQWLTLIAGSLLVFTLSAVVAAYRYFSLYGISLTTQLVLLTASSQASNEFVDGARVHDYGYLPMSLARSTLLAETKDSVPRFFRSLFELNQSPEGGASMGMLASRALNQEFVGGIRIGTVGEWQASFGIMAMVVLGILLGMIVVMLDRQHKNQSQGLILNVTGSILVVSVLIVGTGSLVSAIAVYGITWILVPVRHVQNPHRRRGHVEGRKAALARSQ
jgi:hypothetical protein